MSPNRFPINDYDTEKGYTMLDIGCSLSLEEHHYLDHPDMVAFPLDIADQRHITAANDGVTTTVTGVDNTNAARDALVLQYMPLARAMARRVTSLQFDDAVQEATMGLIHAAGRFDKSRNTMFSTYARYWIVEALQRAAIRALPVHVPLHVAKASMAKSRRVAAGDHTESKIPESSPPVVTVSGAESSEDKRARTGERRLDHAFATVNARATRAELENEEGEPRHGDTLTQNPWQAVDNRVDASTITVLLNRLSKRQRHALMLNFGIYGRDPLTLEETGDVMGISREGARQLIVRGLDLLRDQLQVSL